MENFGSLKEQIAQRIKEANNVLVTVSNNPSVDQLASAIGLTLLLNKMGKHGTAVFSGQVPSTIEFLEPEKTLEKNTDSLRDFIIALDKSKADKLRYKVEDKLVKIFITPYRTSLSDKDLDFSQGDFNVDVVIALGVKKREQLDQAIVAHGRILHDATVISINIDNHVELGTMNLVDSEASSLSEMAMSLIDMMQSGNLLDGQMATAFLTGIVAATDRFRNSKTSPITMNISSKLMAAGANQQLIASKLEGGTVPVKQSGQPDIPGKTGGEGALQIDHEAKQQTAADHASDIIDQIKIDEQGRLVPSASDNSPPDGKSATPGNPKYVLEPPKHGGTLTASGYPDDLNPPVDAMTLPPVGGPLLSHDAPTASSAPANTVANPLFDASNAAQKPLDDLTGLEDETLTELEEFVESPHLKQVSEPVPNFSEPSAAPQAAALPDSSPVDAARSAVNQAVSGATQSPLEPIAALNANPLDPNLGNQPARLTIEPPPTSPFDAMASQSSGAAAPNLPNIDMPANLVPTAMPTDNTAAPNGQSAPPPVPPPMMPPSLEMPEPTQISPTQPPK